MYYKVTFQPSKTLKRKMRAVGSTVTFNWWGYVHTSVYRLMDHQRDLDLTDHKHRLEVLQKLFQSKVVDWEMVEDEEAESHARLGSAKIYRKPATEVQSNSEGLCSDAHLAGIRLRFVQEEERRVAAGFSRRPLPWDE